MSAVWFVVADGWGLTQEEEKESGDRGGRSMKGGKREEERVKEETEKWGERGEGKRNKQ